MSISDQNRATIEAILPDHGDQSVMRLYPEPLNRLMDAARAEGAPAAEGAETINQKDHSDDGLPLQLDRPRHDEGGERLAAKGAALATAAGTRGLDALSPPAAEGKEDAARIAEVMAEGDGFWRSCSGCHETEDGHDVGHYPFSKAFNCKLGGGCGECGGLGAIWDTTDYEAMVRELSNPAPAAEPTDCPAR